MMLSTVQMSVVHSSSRGGCQGRREHAATVLMSRRALLVCCVCFVRGVGVKEGVLGMVLLKGPVELQMCKHLAFCAAVVSCVACACLIRVWMIAA